MKIQSRRLEAEVKALSAALLRQDIHAEKIEAALREACGLMVRFILEGDSTVEEAVDAFLVRQAEYSGVTSNAFTAETASEPEAYKGMEAAPAWIDDGAGGLVNLGMALSKTGTAK